MVWGKRDDRSRGNAKLRAVGKAVRGGIMMVWGYCDEQRSNGWAPQWVIDQELTAAELKIALTIKANGRSALLHKFGDGSDCECLDGVHWTEEMAGFWVHDWLVYNPSKAENTVHRAKRKELSDKDLVHLVKMRDGNSCRYCGVIRPWNDQRSERKLTIDHLNPRVAGGAENLVVACMFCNCSKKDASTPEAAGLVLLPPPVAGTVPANGWPADFDPALVEREEPAPIDPPIDVGSTDPTTDRSPIGDRSGDRSDPPVDPQPGDSPVENRQDRADATTRASPDSTAGDLPLGRGGGGSGSGKPPVRTAGDVGPAGRRPVVGPATTPRSATSPPTYHKGSTSNPPPPEARPT